jgi:hypothetical protein
MPPWINGLFYWVLVTYVEVYLQDDEAESDPLKKVLRSART